MIFDKLFQLMAEKQASDIFITAGAPIHIKIQGNTVPVNQQVMLPDMIEKIGPTLVCSAITMPSATQSQRLMPAKMLTSIALTLLSASTKRKAFSVRSTSDLLSRSHLLGALMISAARSQSRAFHGSNNACRRPV